MSTSIRDRLDACQVSPDARDVVDRTTSVARQRDLLRMCISDLDYSFEALAVAMGKEPSYKGYISRVLDGEKPMTLEFIDALPDDIEAEWHSRSAEEHGRIVVEPSHGEDAVRNLVSGIFGVLAPRLPSRADRMLKAELVPARKAVAR